MIHGLQFFLQKVSIAYYVITERIGIISLKAAVWNFRGVRKGFERGRYLICLREENSYLFIYSNLFPYIPFRYIPWERKEAHSLYILRHLQSDRTNSRLESVHKNHSYNLHNLTLCTEY